MRGKDPAGMVFPVHANVFCITRKYKLPNYQHGHAYLTSHRICYVDVKDPRKYSVAIDLKDVDRIEYQVDTQISRVLFAWFRTR
jgi:hypothetical protein